MPLGEELAHGGRVRWLEEAEQMCPVPPEDTWPVPFLSCPLLTKKLAYRLCELIQSCLSKPLQGQSWAVSSLE